MDGGNPLLELSVLSYGDFDAHTLCVELNARDFTVDQQVIARKLLAAEVILVLQLMVEQRQDALIEFINLP